MAGRFGGQARVLLAVFFQQGFQMPHHMFGQVLEVFADFIEFRLGLLHFFPMLVDVKQGNAADAHLQ